MKNVAVVGATGYTGQELIRLLLQHKEINVRTVVSQSSHGKPLASVYPSLARQTDLILSNADLEQVANECDLVFLALPHMQAASRITAAVLKKCAVIDLSADFRLKEKADYSKWYHAEHPNPELLASAVYGLPELHRDAIRASRLIANPGCYATCSILSVAPLLHSDLIAQDSIIIDAKSGASGAGRATTLGMHFDEVDENFKAYAVASHRHTPEIEQELSLLSGEPIKLSFTPHLVPMNRGILCTTYANLKADINTVAVRQIFQDFYGKEFFIRLFDQETADYPFPETRWVKGSNFCDIGLTVDERTRRVIVVAALDNLIKGAAGQAIQNMNLLFGWDEQLGLKQAGVFPA